MSIAMRLKYKVERDAPLVTRMPVTLLMQGDEAANEIVVEMLDGGAPMALSGYSAALYLRRIDGIKVRCVGTVDGNIVRVTLTAECYSIPGNYIASMVLSDDVEDRTVLRLAGYVESDGDGPVIDPSGSIPSYDDLARAFAELEAAIKEAERATANASAEAENAGSAAIKANNAAEAANNAAQDASGAAADATQAAQEAEEKAALADTAAQEAEAGAAAATQAAQEAEEKAALADAAAQGAQASAAAATQAAQEAEAKAALADEAAQGAEASAGEANAAAGRANAAAESIEGLTISESVVEYGAGVEASVTRDPESGALHLAIQTERGPQGPGYTIKGPAYATVEALAAAVTSPAVGDQYNVGAAAPYDVYRWTGSEWEDQGTIQGPAGLDAPQINDDEALSTNPWSGLKTKNEIEKVEGKIYPCTAAALEAMSTEDLVGIYDQGYRAIKTENNGTVVLLGLASNGSLEWLGCNEDTTNLLDNPDFAIAQAGHGGMHGNTTYAADRWVSSNLSNASFDGEKLVVVDDGSSLGAVYQKLIFNSPCKITITAGVAVQNAWEITMFDAESGAKIASSAGSQAQEALLNAEITSDLTGKEISIFFYLFPGSAGGGSAKIFNAALYKGSYTPKTLPPYVPKGYAAELAECLRYYQAVSSDSWTTCARPLGSAEFLVNLSAASPMRTVPQIAGKFKLFLANGWNEELAPVSIALTVCGYTTKIATQVDAEIGKAYIVTGTYELIADL